MFKDSKEMIMKTVGQNILALRLARSMPLEELAEHMELTPGFIGLLERGKRSATGEILNKLSEIFQVSTDVLLCSPDVERAGKNTRTVQQDKIHSILQNLDEEELKTVENMIRLYGRTK